MFELARYLIWDSEACSPLATKFSSAGTSAGFKVSPLIATFNNDRSFGEGVEFI